MTKLSHSLCSTLILLIATCLPAFSQERFTTSQLRQLGVNTSTLQPITFNHQDTIVAAFDRAPFEVKKRGTFHRLWFFEVDARGQLGRTKMIELPLKSVQQGEFSPDDQHFVVLGERGTTFLSVNMNTMDLTTLLEPSWGQAGFRSEPAVLWSEAGKLFVQGHHYDKERFIQPRTVATLQLDDSKGSHFKSGPNVAKIEKKLDRLWFSNYVTDQSAFFGQKFAGTTLLSHWNGESVTEIDRATKFLGFWGNAGRLIYTSKAHESANCSLKLYDSDGRSLQTLASSPKDFKYLFLSRNGGTLVTSQVSNSHGLLETFYAREEDDWELLPAVRDERDKALSLAAGWMRLSSEGNLLCHIGPGGLSLHPLP